jgi:hypothetical protein
MQDKAAAPRAAAGAAAAAISSGTNYTRANLAAQVDQQRGKASDQAAAAGPLATPKGLAACLGALGATASPSFVDVAKFEGKPAAIIVLPAQDGGREIWVVSPTCSAGNDGTRFFTSVR